MSRDREEFMAEGRVAVLATQGPDGQPHAAPIWYLYEDGEFLIMVDEGSQKHRDVERSPKVTLVIDDREPPYFAVMVRGRAEIGPALDEERRLQMAIRYLGEENGRRWFGGQSGQLRDEARAGPSGVTIRIRPERFIEYPKRAE